MVKETMWVVGRVVEMLGSIVAGMIGYFLLINDPEFPVTPTQEPFVWAVFVFFASLAVLGAWLTRLADRPDFPDESELPCDSASALTVEGSPPSSAHGLLPFLGTALVTFSLSWALSNARKRRVG